MLLCDRNHYLKRVSVTPKMSVWGRPRGVVHLTESLAKDTSPGTNTNVPAVLICHKSSKGRHDVGFERSYRMVSLVQLGQITGVQEAEILR